MSESFILDDLFVYASGAGRDLVEKLLGLNPAEKEEATLREEYGNQLLAAQAEAEGLQEELRKMTALRNQAVTARDQAIVRASRYGEILQRVYKSHQDIDDALRSL